MLPRLSLLVALGSGVITAAAAATGHPNTKPGDAMSASQVISLLDLEPNPEKGYYVESFRDAHHLPCASNHSASTAIYYLLTGDESPSLWHKVDRPEVWHHYAGAPLSLYLADDEGGSKGELRLGTDLAGGMRPQGVVPQGIWQRARSWGEWTLVGTTVAPGFESSGVIVKPEGWQPGNG